MSWSHWIWWLVPLLILNLQDVLQDWMVILEILLRAFFISKSQMNSIYSKRYQMKQNEMTRLSWTRWLNVFRERTLYRNRRKNWKSVIMTESSKGMNRQHEKSCKLESKWRKDSLNQKDFWRTPSENEMNWVKFIISID